MEAPNRKTGGPWLRTRSHTNPAPMDGTATPLCAIVWNPDEDTFSSDPHTRGQHTTVPTARVGAPPTRRSPSPPSAVNTSE